MRGSKVPRRGDELKELGIISDGSLLIKDGVIDQVGPTRRVENLAAARGAVEISAVGRVVMPGFVDSHTHLVFPPPSTPVEEMEAAARAVRAGTGQRLQVRTQAYLEAMARHGTTTVEAKTGCGPDESAETKLLRVLAALKNNPLFVVPTFLFRLPRSGSPAPSTRRRCTPGPAKCRRSTSGRCFAPAKAKRISISERPDRSANRGRSRRFCSTM